MIRFLLVSFLFCFSNAFCDPGIELFLEDYKTKLHTAIDCKYTLAIQQILEATEIYQSFPTEEYQIADWCFHSVIALSQNDPSEIISMIIQQCEHYGKKTPEWNKIIDKLNLAKTYLEI